MMGSSSCLPAREGAVVLHSRLRFLSSRNDECTGNREPGAIGLGSLGLESDALGSPSALWARDRDNQLSWGLGQRRVRAETACRTFDRPRRLAKCSLALVLRTTATTLRSTALARGAGGSKYPVGRQVTDGRALTRARVRLPSVYPLRDHSRSQVFVDEGES